MTQVRPAIRRSARRLGDRLPILYSMGRRLGVSEAFRQRVLIDYPVTPSPRYGHGRPPHRELHAAMNARRGEYARVLAAFGDHAGALAAIPQHEQKGSAEPSWRNRWLPFADAAALYALVASRRPRRYMEVGSGQSTRFTRRAIRDGRLDTEIVSIDPHPRAEIDAICDRVVRHRLEDVDVSVFDELEAGDVLFFDGSHRCFTNSDVTVFFLEILPRLRSGILVHIHDIWLPYDYPPAWSYRYYSEQYLLAAHLLAKPDTKIVLPNAFVAADGELNALLDPLRGRTGMAAGAGDPGTSFWFET